MFFVTSGVVGSGVDAYGGTCIQANSILARLCHRPTTEMAFERDQKRFIFPVQVYHTPPQRGISKLLSVMQRRHSNFANCR